MRIKLKEVEIHFNIWNRILIELFIYNNYK